MRRFRFTVSLAALIVANLVPLLGVLFFRWNAASLVFLYWIENLIVGAYTIIKLAAVQQSPPSAHVSKLFFIPFFLVHYSIFCAVHGMFLKSFFDVPPALQPFVSASDSIASMFLPQMLASIVRGFGSTPSGWISWAILGLFASHGISLIQNTFLGGEYKMQSLARVMFQPYTRIVVLHVAILVTGFAVMAAGSPMALLVILIALKLGLDLVLYIRQHAI